MSTNTTPTTTESTAQLTDKQKLEALFTEFGIGFKRIPSFSIGPNANVPSETTIYCSANEARIDGYNGFETSFEFDADGKFVKMDIYE
jgi:hypothetical protein